MGCLAVLPVRIALTLLLTVDQQKILLQRVKSLAKKRNRSHQEVGVALGRGTGVGRGATGFL